MSKILLKAKKDAPETLQIGNLSVELKDGFYRTDNREFADYIIAQNLGDETVAKPKTARRKPATRASATKVKPATKAKPAAETTKQANAESVSPAINTEKSNEGETK